MLNEKTKKEKKRKEKGQKPINNKIGIPGIIKSKIESIKDNVVWFCFAFQ